MVSVLGLYADDKNGILYVCSSDAGNSLQAGDAQAAIKAFDLSDGALAGSDAYASTPTLSAAVVVAFADGLLVRITAPTTAEALAVASSLRPAD